jgi:hypothetical protein
MDRIVALCCSASKTRKKPGISNSLISSHGQLHNNEKKGAFSTPFSKSTQRNKRKRWDLISCRAYTETIICLCFPSATTYIMCFLTRIYDQKGGSKSHMGGQVDRSGMLKGGGGGNSFFFFFFFFFILVFSPVHPSTCPLSFF